MYSFLNLENKNLFKNLNSLNIIILLAGKGQMNVVMDKTNCNDKMDALVNYKQTYEALINPLSPKSD